MQGVIGTALTGMNVDKSAILEELLSREYQGEEESLLGELQLSFVAFFLGEVLEAFEQWKRLFALLCHSYEAMRKHKELFAKVVVVFYEQVRQLPKDFFLCELSERNFVGVSL